MKKTLELEMGRRTMLRLAFQAGTVKAESGHVYDMATSGKFLRIGEVEIDIGPIIAAAVEMQELPEGTEWA